VFSVKPPHPEDAACRDSEVNFFPAVGDYRMAQRAKAICATCPIIDECREYAIDNHYETYGVWGGTTRLERKQIYTARNRGRRRKRRAA
jgi:WhiB family redox-sensing transcriptional regulator